MVALSNGVLGVNVDRVTDGTTTFGEDAEFALGTKVFGVDGTDYTYVQAGEAISTTTDEPYALCIDENFEAKKATAAGALDNHAFGQEVPMRVTASTGADVVLGLGGVGSSGRLAASVTASAGNAIVLGVMITAAASASASAGNTIRNAIVTNPIWTTAAAD
jgi:methylmalonyl-CoA mutase cobalamin-binding subunit